MSLTLNIQGNPKMRYDDRWEEQKAMRKAGCLVGGEGDGEGVGEWLPLHHLEGHLDPR